MKKLVALGVFGAMLASALPAAAVTVNGSVTVKWNTAIIATLALNTNYDATGAQQLTAPSILTNNNTGAGTCTAAGAGSEVAATVNFGSITPDFSQPTGCLYKNGVDAKVTTNSTSWSMTETLAAAAVSGSVLCALGNGQTFPFPATGALPATQTARVAAVAGAACPAGSLTLTAAASTAITSTTAYTGGAHIGQDMQLILTGASPTGAQTETVNYQVIAN
ncbi:MAG: hypothetical protein NVSMB31_15250 [Vulcanimicrobiaceae bacterium]